MIQGVVEVDTKFSKPWHPKTPKIQTSGIMDARKMKIKWKPL